MMEGECLVLSHSYPNPFLVDIDEFFYAIVTPSQ